MKRMPNSKEMISKLSKMEGTKALPKNANSLERLRFELHQKFVIYKIKHNCTQKELADKLEIDEDGMTRYIIGTIADLDVPLTAQQKGNRAFRYYLENTKAEDVQKDRDAVLSTNVSDIKSFYSYPWVKVASC